MSQACKGEERVSEVSQDFGVDISVFSRIFKAKRRDNTLKNGQSQVFHEKQPIDKRVSF